MSPELRWISAPQPSLLHAATMLAMGHSLVDVELARALRPIVADTNRELLLAGAAASSFWASVVPWSAGLAASAAPPIVERLVARLAGCDCALTASELALRVGPLREAWEARGPGLWRSLCQALGEKLPLPRASVILVRPVLGGGGIAFSEYACVSFEALLANPHRELPEIVRLGWLLAQLAPLQPRPSPVALVPPMLAAAEAVELARCDLPTFETALSAWRLAGEAESRTLAPQLFTAWQAFTAPSPARTRSSAWGPFLAADGFSS